MITEAYKIIIIKALKIKTYIQSLNLYTETLAAKIIVRVRLLKVNKDIKNACARIIR